MSFTIAVSGKGGVGKTTIAALFVSRLIAKDHKPVLAVDADPNTCLDEVLGVNVQSTIGGVREEAKEIAGKGMAAGISKQELLELKIEESIVETDHFDLIAMGRPEGPGCYCYANNVLKNALSKLSGQYPFVVIDNEAGLENLSRRIVQQVDILIVVTDPSKRGLDTVRRLHQLTGEMGIQYKKLVLCINRMRSKNSSESIDALKQEINADFLLEIPENDEIAEKGESGENLAEIGVANAAVEAVDTLVEKTVSNEIR